MSQRLSPLSLSCNPLRTQRRRSVLPPFVSAAPTARYHDYIRFQTSGKLKVALNYVSSQLTPACRWGRSNTASESKVYGPSKLAGQSRVCPCPRVIGFDVVAILTPSSVDSYQQDFYGFATLSLDPRELQYTLRTKLNCNWDPSGLPDFIASQVHFIGLYDGHGGSTASQFCRQEFHALFENAHQSHIPELYEWIKEVGGYFNRRLRPRPLLPWLQDPNSKAVFDLEARATTTFFEVSSCAPLSISCT